LRVLSFQVAHARQRARRGPSGGETRRPGHQVAADECRSNSFCPGNDRQQLALDRIARHDHVQRRFRRPARRGSAACREQPREADLDLGQRDVRAGAPATR